MFLLMAYYIWCVLDKITLNVINERSCKALLDKICWNILLMDNHKGYLKMKKITILLLLFQEPFLTIPF